MREWMDARHARARRSMTTRAQPHRPSFRAHVKEGALLTLASTPCTMACNSDAWTASLAAAACSYRSCAARKPA